MRVAIGLHLFQPIFDMCKGFPPGYIIDQQCSNCAPIVRPGNRAKVFLASSVPDLEFDIFFLDGDCFCAELHTDCDIMGGSSFVFDELQHNAGLADPSIPDYNELEQIMV